MKTTPCSLLCAGVLVALLFGAVCARAAPSVQKSELFEKVARKVIERYALARLKDVCTAEEIPAERQQACVLLVDELIPLAALALKEGASSSEVLDEMRSLASRALGAAMMSEGASLIAAELLFPTKVLGLDTKALEPDVVSALSCAGHSLLSGGSLSSCAGTTELIKRATDLSTNTRCDAQETVGSRIGCALSFRYREFLGGVPALTDEDRRAMAVQFAITMQLVLPAVDAFSAPGKATERLETLFEALDEKQRDAFEDVSAHDATTAVPSTRHPMAPALAARDALSASADPCATELRQRLSDAGRHQLFLQAAGAAMSGDLGGARVAADLLRVPATCGAAVTGNAAVQRWARYARTYGFVTELHARVVAARGAAMATAALLDAVEGEDATALLRAEETLLPGLARQGLAAAEDDVWNCEESVDDTANARLTASCVRYPKGGAAVPVTAAYSSGAAPSGDDRAAFDGLVDELLEKRFTKNAAETTCAGQLLSAIFERSLPSVRLGFGAVCRRLADGPAERALDSVLASGLLRLEPIPGLSAPGARLFRWNAGASGVGILAELRQNDPTIGRRLAAGAIERLPKSKEASLQALHEAVTRAVASQARSVEPAQLSRTLLGAGMKLVKVPLTRFVDSAFGVRDGKCTAESLRCLAHALASTVIEPLIDALLEGTDRETAVRRLLAEIEKADIIGRSPLLVDVGPAATLLYDLRAPANPDSLSVHLTVLDKWGLACKWGERRDWQLGVFAGGFLDAAVRTLAGDVESPRIFVGAALGWREIWPTIPLGVELHAVWAPPIEVKQLQEDIGTLATFGGGVSVIVPIDDVLED